MSRRNPIEMVLKHGIAGYIMGVKDIKRDIYAISDPCTKPQTAKENALRKLRIAIKQKEAKVS